MASSAANGATTGLAALEARYRRFLITQCEPLSFGGLSGAGLDIHLRLEDVYVELKTVADVPEAADTWSADERRLFLETEARGQRDDADLRMQFDSLRAERWLRERRAGHASVERRSIEEALADGRHAGLVMLGDPGSGKSTLLRYLALRAARLGLPDAVPASPREAAALCTPDGAGRLPILVPVAAYDEWLSRSKTPVPLGRFLSIYFETSHGIEGLDPLFRQALEEGRTLVLFDGLDEVRDAGTRKHVAQQWRALIHPEAGRDNRFVVTSRIIGYRDAPLPGELSHVTVLEFGNAEIRAFARKWCAAYEVAVSGGRSGDALVRAAAEEKALLADIRDKPSVARLAANPLLLAMLARLRRQDQSLPAKRMLLYERYTEVLLDHWAHARSEGARVLAQEGFDRKRAVELLSELSLWLLQHKPAGTARKREVVQALEAIGLQFEGVEPGRATTKERRAAADQAETFVKEMRYAAGLLAERGQDAFGFLHLTFQEYFAGQALARREAEERWALLGEQLHHPRWREVLLLCAGQLGVVEGRRRAVSELGRRALGAGSAHEDLLNRDVLLAAAMAAEDVGFDQELLKELSGRLVKLTESRIPEVRLEALRGLSRLAQIGFDDASRWLEESIRRKERVAEISLAIAGRLGANTCKSLTQAIYAWLDEPDEECRHAAVSALGALVESDAEVRRLVLDKLNDPNVSVRNAAVKVLGSFVGSDAEVRRLVLDRLNDPELSVWEATVEALGPLVGSDAEVRRLVLDKLEVSWWGLLLPPLKAVGPFVGSNEQVRRLVLNKLNDSDGLMRQAAVESLGSLVRIDAKVRGLVIDKLDDPWESVQRAAIDALSSSAANDEQLRRVMLDKSNDPSPEIRQALIKALRPIAGNDAGVRGLVLNKLEDMRCSIVREMLPAFERLAGSDAEVRRLILDKLNDTDEHVRHAAVVTLGPLAGSDAEVHRLILDKLNDTEGWVQRAAVMALGPLAGSDTEVRRLVLDKLNDTGGWVRAPAITALASLVERDAEVRRLILDKLNDTDWDVREVAVAALASLVERDAEVRRLILDKLNDPNESVRRATVATLASLVKRDAEVRRLILDKLNDTEGWVRAPAVMALAPLAASDAEVRRLILDKLNDTEGWVRRVAFEALGLSVQSNAEVRRLVLDKLNDPDRALQEAAIATLGSLVSGDAEVRRLVLDKLRDQDFEIRHVAIRALIPLVAGDSEVRQLLLRWLGIAPTDFHLQSLEETRRQLADAYAPLLGKDPALLAQITEMLRSPAWPERLGAAWALTGMPGGPPPELLPTLRGLLADQRGEQSWPARLQAAATLLNDRDPSMSQRAITLTLEALEYATNPWYHQGLVGSAVHRQAAEILGTLDPVYRNDAIIARLCRVLREEDGQVLDAAYHALLRLLVSPGVEHDIETWLDAHAKPQQELLSFPSPTMAIPQLPKPLLEAYRNGKLALFVGSGLSLGADVAGDFPTWSQLPDRLLDAANRYDALPPEAIAAKRIVFKARMPLEGMLAELGTLRTALNLNYQNALNDIFRPNHAHPGAGHHALLALGVHAILTTNYDQLLEMMPETPRRQTYNRKEATLALGDLRAGRRVLLKVHGSAERHDTVVLSEREYDEARVDCSYQAVLSFLLQDHVFLFVGYGMNDPLDLDLALKGNAADFKTSSQRHYVLLRSPSDADRDRLERDYNVRVIPYADHAELPAVLASLAVSKA